MSTTLKSVISGMCALAIFGSVGAIELNEREKKILRAIDGMSLLLILLKHQLFLWLRKMSIKLLS